MWCGSNGDLEFDIRVRVQYCSSTVHAKTTGNIVSVMRGLSNSSLTVKMYSCRMKLFANQADLLTNSLSPVSIFCWSSVDRDTPGGSTLCIQLAPIMGILQAWSTYCSISMKYSNVSSWFVWTTVRTVLRWKRLWRAPRSRSQALSDCLNYSGDINQLSADAVPIYTYSTASFHV